MKKTIVTIGRQFGSGGRVIGKKLAEELGVPYYDNELITLAAKKSGIAKELFEAHDEKPTNSLLYTLVMDTYALGTTSPAYAGMPLNHRIFLAQFDTIKNIAEEGSCIIVGRCADYVLRGNQDCLNVFIHAPLKNRVERATTVYEVPVDGAIEHVQKMDKKRANYYNYYSDKKWGNVENYHLSIDSSVLGIDATADMLYDFVMKASAEK